MSNSKNLLQTWRWYGPNDPVSLSDIKQAGATGVVSALHHIPHGDVWPLDEILERKEIIARSGLSWEVVESVPVHESIKIRDENCEFFLDNYRQTLQNLAKAGLKTVCYNFMPVLDWTRTNLSLTLPNGAKALYFDWIDLAIFDKHILKRAECDKEYKSEVLNEIEERLASYSNADMQRLADVILMGVPTEGSITLDSLTKSLDIYKVLGKEGLFENLFYFLRSIQSICEQEGIVMTLHPDDPPYPILGLPRIASNLEDLTYIFDQVKDKFNGFCFCTGSLGAGQHNNLTAIIEKIGDRIFFAHLRNVRKDTVGNFFESDHLDGDVDMYGIMKSLVSINQSRINPIPFRPDHGHQMLDDLNKDTNPGYSAIGRLKGLAELRGLELGILRSFY